jgi:hypothetical protein
MFSLVRIALIGLTAAFLIGLGVSTPSFAQCYGGWWNCGGQPSQPAGCQEWVQGQCTSAYKRGNKTRVNNAPQVNVTRDHRTHHAKPLPQRATTGAGQKLQNAPAVTTTTVRTVSPNRIEGSVAKTSDRTDNESGGKKKSR